MSDRRHRGSVATVVLVAALLATCGVAQATFHGRNGRIAFSDFMTGQIYAVNPDGSGLDRLTHIGSKLAADSPSWSANGKRIAFDKFNVNTLRTRLWVMRANGSHEHNLGSTKRFDDQTPAYTPNGRQIVFSRCKGEACAIWKMRSNGTHQHALTRFHEPSETVDVSPMVSPNGKRIAFTRFNKGGIHTRIFLIRTDGTHAHAVTPWRLEALLPDWKPNGRRIVFSSNGFRTGSSVFTMRPNGSSIHRVTPDRYPFNDVAAVYSPKGNRLAFISDRNYPDECCNDLFEIDPNGADETLIDTGLSPPGILDPAWGTHPLAP